MNNNCVDLFALSLLACQISECIDDTEQLELLAADLTTLADMLASISARREVCTNVSES